MRDETLYPPRLGYAPRIIVFGVRRFDGEINEWRPMSRTETSIEARYQGATVEKGNRGTTRGETTESATATIDSTTMQPSSAQTLDYDDESLLFDRSFVAGLVNAGATVIDRDVVVRSEAAHRRKNDAAGDVVLSARFIETYAIENGADLIAQIEILGRGQSCEHREYIVSIKSVRDGIVHAVVSSEEVLSQFETTRVIGTRDGYKRVTESVPYDCQALARAMAEEVSARMGISH